MDTPNSGPTNDTAGRKDALGRLPLLAIVLSAAAALAVAYWTRARIEANELEWFVARLESLVPSALHDNDLFKDRIIVSAPDMLGSNPISIFRARRNAGPTAAILTAFAPDGYGGTIELLVGVDYEGKLLGVDVLKHNETRGIGDGFAPYRSNWLGSLVGRSLNDPPATRWTIRKDGGEFDQFTGASITPRAILKATRRTLEYYSTHRERIFNAPSQTS